MGIEQVGKGTPGKQFVEVLDGIFGFQQPGVETHDPGLAPSGMASAIGESTLECFLCSVENSGVFWRNQVQRVEAQQVGHVPVTRFHFRIILDPLLQGSIGGDLKRRQLFSGFVHLGNKVRIQVQLLGRVHEIVEKGIDDVYVDGGHVAQL